MGKNKVINPGWPQYENYTFAPAVRRGNMLYISGQDGIRINPKTGEVEGKGDMMKQCRIAYEKIDAILQAAGATWDDVVQLNDYVTTTDGYKGTAEIRRQYFKNGFPASTGYVVVRLLRREAMIEIDGIVALDK